MNAVTIASANSTTLDKWPFQLFIENLPTMLQIALLLPTCGLSRYVRSANTSLVRVVIFTVLKIFFYVGIAVAGASSYKCPFQTPASQPGNSCIAYLQPSSYLPSTPLVGTFDVAGEPVSTQHRLTHLRHLDGCLARIISASHRAYNITRRLSSCLAFAVQLGTSDTESSVRWAATNLHQRCPPSVSTTCTSQWSWVTNACMESGKHSKTERGQCALRLLGSLKHR